MRGLSLQAKRHREDSQLVLRWIFWAKADPDHCDQSRATRLPTLVIVADSLQLLSGNTMRKPSASMYLDYFVAEEKGPTNKILRTPMFPLGYGVLVEGGNTQWNTVAMPNNPQCDNKLSAPKPDAYLAYPRGAKSPWTVKRNNVVNHPRIRPYSQPAKRNTFPSLSLELKAESAGGVLTTAEAQAASNGSQSVNSILWLLEEAKAAGLTEVDLIQDTVSFSIISSHR